MSETKSEGAEAPVGASGAITRSGVSDIDKTMSDVDQYRALARGIFRELEERGTTRLSLDFCRDDPGVLASVALEASDAELDKALADGLPIGPLEPALRRAAARRLRPAASRPAHRPGGTKTERNMWVRRFVQWLEEAGLDPNVARLCVVKDSGLKSRTVRDICGGN